MNTEKSLVGCATLLLLVFMGSCTVTGFDKREKWAEAVKNGADPMAASCALYSADSSADYVTCYAVANKR